MLHQKLTLHVSSDAYVLDPADEAAEIAQKLVLIRRTGELKLSGPKAGTVPIFETSSTVYGIMGIISLITSDFLVVITGREPRGQIDGHTIYLATDFKLLPLAPPPSALSPTEKHLLQLVENHLRDGVFWFSYGWDLTTRLQAQYSPLRDGRPLWELADDRFFWNKHLQSRLIDCTRKHPETNLSRFILPVIYGSFDMRFTSISRIPFVLCLISRRSRYHAGTRYFTRGLNPHGHAANFNETEQLILLDSPSLEQTPAYTIPQTSLEPVRRGSGLGAAMIQGTTRMSLVQTRGSAPIGFAEINNLRYVPDLSIMDSPQMVKAFDLHVDEQLTIYGSRVIFVNLVNSRGRERLVKEDFELRIKEREVARSTASGGRERVVIGRTRATSTSLRPDTRGPHITTEQRGFGHSRASASLAQPMIKPNNPVQYHYFDFHKECSKMRFDRVYLLLDRLESSIQEGGYFHTSAHRAPPTKSQNSVIRSNCMDCLDRTNVVQAAVAKRSLTLQLRAAGVLLEKDTVDNHEDFMAIFREVWADHADYISEAYSGTPALKTDFTRTGQRTKAGLWKDFVSSCKRYITNNYMDGERQDAFDLFTGAWVAQGGLAVNAVLSVSDHRPLRVQYMPFLLVFSLVMLISTLAVPQLLAYTGQSLIGLWVCLCVFSLTYILSHGVEYVSWPQLNPPTDVIAYDGPGIKTPEHGRGQLSQSLRTLPLTRWLGKQLRAAGIGGSRLGLASKGSRRVPVKVASKLDEVEMGRKRMA